VARRKKFKEPPTIASPEAGAIIERAATAAGLSVEGLTNLIVDSGAIALPPSDGITERYTLEDLGLRLWGMMQEQRPSQRIEWFNNMVPAQQTAVIVVLRNRGYSTDTVAREFGLSVAEVQRTWNKHADDLGAQVVGLRLNTIAGQMQMASERAQQLAIENDDAATYWRIEKERIAMLQSLGIVDRAIHKVEVQHSFNDQTKVEINALLELERKKREATARIAMSNGEDKVDDVPFTLTDYESGDDKS